ncbi:MAG: beta-lactamase family protein [Tatlockia sp.]|nr:beta-lactamase family protein [Tatlockia sp.]
MLERIDLAQIIRQRGISCAAVALCSTDKIETKLAGNLAKESQQAINEETIFEAASLTKPFFAFLVMKLAEKGKINLDKPLLEQLEQLGKKQSFGPPYESIYDPPIFKENYQKVTPRQLLSHQAGLHNEFDPQKPETFEYKSALGTAFDYSGEGYRFLQEGIEKLIGQDAFEMFAEEVLKELRMTRTSFYNQKQDENRAVGYKADGVSSLEHKEPNQIHAGASLTTTIIDYAKFLRACLQDPNMKKIIDKPAVPSLKGKDKVKLQSKDTLDHLGWSTGFGIQTQEKKSLAFHWGDNKYFRNFMVLDLDSDQALVCFTNSYNGAAILQEIAEQALDKDLNPIFTWLREGYDFRENVSAIYRDNLKELKNETEDSSRIQPK